MSISTEINNCTRKNQAAIALGSNLGESKDNLQTAVARIKLAPQIELIQCSHWYQTKPVGPPQPDYINGCITIHTTFTPIELLNFLLIIELIFGRERNEKWGARTLDLDLILYDDLILDLPNLKVPHPLMRERVFVLIPLAEIAPDWVDPVSKLTVSALANKLNYHSDEIKILP
ncbi:2-amino-4-hydroxy-6-hydroxymethyldihydropteridin epyrophosphokinase [Cyanobacterium stanieri PCC 7202]|uniref:2-amino-4-hydroxy-6-hydroxymethyldihydropteridine diphosphokinase n=1 Tax=Cyanobacterium stanieri (strain ATCC 29140 / PCC 7202) TaxID=292563 RepID=K9YLF2_CYASC|nr:2-amino-4-hydroxy-6-hydroxymethyldihydropteridin epyrophosphokinase [Cyanobacterium stanieri PCC 7202]